MRGMTTFLSPSNLAPFPAARRPGRARPLRVALFSGNYDCVRDGANRALNRLVGHLLERVGAEVRIYSPTAPQKAFASVGDVHSVRSAAIPGRPEYRLALGFTRTAQRDMAAFAPDIVHLSAPDILGRQAQKAARQAGIPVVASLHTRFETYLDYYRLGFLRAPVEAYLDRFYGDSDHILAPTPPIVAEMAGRHGDGKVSLWSRGVDHRAFDPARRDDAFRASLGYAPDDIVPLFFGRLVLEKGLAVFADTIAALRDSGHAVRPMVVGDGPARDWLARRLPNVTFLGLLEGAELGRAVASADLLINPSVTEAFGNVNLEAMAAGLAVLSADVPSAASLIADGKTGMLVPPGDIRAFAAAARALIDRPAARVRLGHAARAAALRYDWGAVLDAVATVYDRLHTGDRPAELAKVA